MCIRVYVCVCGLCVGWCVCSKRRAQAERAESLPLTCHGPQHRLPHRHLHLRQHLATRRRAASTSTSLASTPASTTQAQKPPHAAAAAAGTPAARRRRRRHLCGRQPEGGAVEHQSEGAGDGAAAGAECVGGGSELWLIQTRHVQCAGGQCALHPHPLLHELLVGVMGREVVMGGRWKLESK